MGIALLAKLYAGMHLHGIYYCDIPRLEGMLLGFSFFSFFEGLLISTIDGLIITVLRGP